MAKVRLNHDDQSPMPVLLTVIERSLRMLHPFMPFITEELWQTIKAAGGFATDKSSIMISEYPQFDEAFHFEKEEAQMSTLTEIVRTLRNTRSEYEVDINKTIDAYVYCGELADVLSPYTATILTLAKATVRFEEKRTDDVPKQSIVEVLPNAEIIIPMASLFDLEAQLAKLNKELDEAVKEQARLESHLNDETFRSRAPQQVIEKEQARLDAALEKQAKLREHIKNLAG
jgi:valyl-tRNA synthetase